jgi:hypothetical protein
MTERTLTGAIMKACGGIYRIKRLGPNAIVKGQAFSYLQQSLRLDGWRGVSYSNLSQQISASGCLAMERGRGRRHYHGGKMGWGGECDVVYVLSSRSDCTDEELARQEADAIKHGWF